MTQQIDQLWYTSSKIGLGASEGYRVRAASSALKDIWSARVKALRGPLEYELPAGVTTQTLVPGQAPRTLAFLDLDGDRVLINRSFIGQADGRLGIYFSHAVAGLPPAFDALDAIALWRSTFWKTADDPVVGVDLEDVPLDEVRQREEDRRPAAQALLGSALPNDNYLDFVVAAYLALQTGQRLFLAGQCDAIAALIAGLTLCLPAGLLRSLTFSTYESDPALTDAEIVGMEQSPVRPTNDLPERYGGAGLALDCYSGRASDQTLIPDICWSFARFARAQLYGDGARLESLLAHADRLKVRDRASFLHLYQHVYAPDYRGPVTPDAVRFLVENGLLELAIERPAVQGALLDLAVSDHDWWNRMGHFAVVSLRGKPQMDAALDAMVTTIEGHAQAAVLAQNLSAARFLVEELLSAFVSSGATNLWLRLCAPLTVAIPDPDKPSDVLRWPVRDFLLAKWSHEWSQTGETRPSAALACWLDVPWDELTAVLAARFAPSWERCAVQAAVRRKGRLPGIVRKLLDEHQPLFETALRDMLNEENDRQAVVHFFAELEAMGASQSARLLSRVLDSSYDPRAILDAIARRTAATHGDLASRVRAWQNLEAFLDHPTMDGPTLKELAATCVALENQPGAGQAREDLVSTLTGAIASTDDLNRVLIALGPCLTDSPRDLLLELVALLCHKQAIPPSDQVKLCYIRVVLDDEVAVWQQNRLSPNDRLHMMRQLAADMDPRTIRAAVRTWGRSAQLHYDDLEADLYPLPWRTRALRFLPAVLGAIVQTLTVILYTILLPVRALAGLGRIELPWRRTRVIALSVDVEAITASDDNTRVREVKRVNGQLRGELREHAATKKTIIVLQCVGTISPYKKDLITERLKNDLNETIRKSWMENHRRPSNPLTRTRRQLVTHYVIEQQRGSRQGNEKRK